MSVSTNNAYGKISISDLAIAKVASHTAMEAYGIVEMVSRRFTDSLSVLFKKEGEGRGVKITTSGNRIYVDVYVIIKYGVSIGELEYSKEGKEQVFQALGDMLRHFKMFPLYEEEGKACFLLTDTSCVLAMLRYHAPILQSFGAKIRVYSQYGNRDYGIDYSMKFREI